MSLQVNGVSHEIDVLPTATLVEVLRERLFLTGTHVGCDTAQCGACTVLWDGRAVKSCNMLAARCGAGAVTTVEGLAPPGEWHPMQLAFSKHAALQCGFCTPGMLMRAVSMVAEGVSADPTAVSEALAGNLCRCTGYHGIVAAICEAMSVMRTGQEPGVVAPPDSGR